MSNDLNLMVIDDNRRSSHDLEVQLKFIGESPLMTTGQDWQQTLSNNADKAKDFLVMIGAGCETPAPTLVKKIHGLNNAVPIIVASTNNEPGQYPQESQNLVLEMEPKAADYRSLLTVLNKARSASGKSQNSIISDSGTAMFRSLVGESELMQHARELMKKVADKMSNVLVLGESGTGKEIMARNLHYHSGRGERAFVVVKGTTFSPERFIVELFGVEAGHNGAEQTRPGYFEKAHEGTLFLDEVGDLPLDIQAKIMNFLEHQTFERVGGQTSLQADVRIIAATNQNIEEKIAQGEFREDLYYRLSVVPITIPALRDHAEDIPDLISELLARLASKDNKLAEFNATAMISLQRHSWPGNVRELANLIERLSILHPGEVIGVSDLPKEYQHVTANDGNSTGSSSGGQSAISDVYSKNDELPLLKDFAGLNEDSLKEYLASFERNLIDVALKESEGALDFVTARLQVSDEDLRKKMKQHSLV